MTASTNVGIENYYLSLILFADERRRFDEEERDRFFRSFATEL